MSDVTGLGSMGGALISGVIGLIGQNAANRANVGMTAQTNTNNLEIAREGNTFNADQAQTNRDFQREMTNNANEHNDQAVRDMESFQVGQVQSQRDYETQMSNTAYQRAMADMKAAGLNPMLAYSQGGAGTPTTGMATGSAIPSPTASGSTASANIARMEPGHVENALGGFVSAATQAAGAINAYRQSQADLLNKTKQAENTSAQTDLIRSQTLTENEKPFQIKNDRDRTIAQTQQILGQTPGSQADINAAIASAAQSRAGASSAMSQSRLSDSENALRSQFGKGTFGDIAGAINNTGSTILHKLWDGAGAVADYFR